MATSGPFQLWGSRIPESSRCSQILTFKQLQFQSFPEYTLLLLQGLQIQPALLTVGNLQTQPPGLVSWCPEQRPVAGERESEGLPAALLSCPMPVEQPGPTVALHPWRSHTPHRATASVAGPMTPRTCGLLASLRRACSQVPSSPRPLWLTISSLMPISVSVMVLWWEQ